MSIWYYLKNGEQLGPVEAAELKQLALAGTLSPTDQIWKEGLAQWVPAASVKGLFPAQAATGTKAVMAASPVASVSNPAPVEYYSTSGTLPVRAAMALKGFPPPTGSTDQWPLHDKQLRQLNQAGKSRQVIVLLSSYFLLAAIISTAILLYLITTLLVMASMAPRGIRFGSSEWMWFGSVVMGTAATWICWKPTRRCQGWALYTMIGLHCAGAAYIVYVMYQMNTLGGFSSLPAFLVLEMPMCLALGGTLTMAGFCLKGTMDMSHFLAQPVWCQEVFAGSSL